MMRVLVLSIGVGLLVLTATSPIEAQSRRELAARIDASEARLAEIEARALQGDPVAEILTRRMDALEQAQRRLTDEIERLAFENRKMREALEQMGRDVDTLLSQNLQPVLQDPSPLQNGEGGPEPELEDDRFAAVRAESVQPLQLPTGDVLQSGPSADDVEVDLAEARQSQVNVETQGLSSVNDTAMDINVPTVAPEDIYAQGRSRLLEGDFGGAQESFALFTEQYSDHEQADEAYYWLGETYFISGRLDEAADAYIASLQTDRRGPQGPDALVRLSASLSGLGQTQRACQVLATFRNEFPNAGPDARRKAQRELARIGCP